MVGSGVGRRSEGEMKTLVIAGIGILYLVMLCLAIRDDTNGTLLMFLAYLSGACGMYLLLLALGKLKED